MHIGGGASAWNLNQGGASVNWESSGELSSPPNGRAERRYLPLAHSQRPDSFIAGGQEMATAHRYLYRELLMLALGQDSTVRCSWTQGQHHE